VQRETAEVCASGYTAAAAGEDLRLLHLPYKKSTRENAAADILG
jgi:hypothetical protein